VNKKNVKSRFKNRQRVADQNCGNEFQRDGAKNRRKARLEKSDLLNGWTSKTLNWPTFPEITPG